MNNEKIDFNNIKVAIFDFDNTLAIHKDREFNVHRSESEENRINYYLKAYLNPDTFYETIEPCYISDYMYRLVKLLENKGIKMYCVTGMKFSFHLQAKKNFVNKHYGPNIEVISAGSQELKCLAIKIIQGINNCNLNEILFVDELKENIQKFRSMNVQTLLFDETNEM